MTIQLGEILRRGADILGPIILRELSKPRTRRFIEEKVGDVAIELARHRFTKKTKKNIIIRRGKRKFSCRMVR